MSYTKFFIHNYLSAEKTFINAHFQKRDLLVSGSSDFRVKFWCLSLGQLLGTVNTQTEFVVSVLYVPPELTPSNPTPENYMFSMSKAGIHCFSWTDEEGLNFGPQFKKPNLTIPLVSDGQLLNNSFFTPGMHYRDGTMSFVVQTPLFDTPTIGDADIMTVCTRTGNVLRSIHVNQKIRMFMAIGNRFALILMPYVDKYYKNFGVIDLEERKLIGGYTVPHSR